MILPSFQGFYIVVVDPTRTRISNDHAYSKSGQEEKNVRNPLLGLEKKYTPKTCSSSADLKNNLGSGKVHSCVKCSSVFDRKLNAAKSVMLKYIRQQLMSSGESSIASAPSGPNRRLAVMRPGPFVR